MTFYVVGIFRKVTNGTFDFHHILGIWTPNSGHCTRIMCFRKQTKWPHSMAFLWVKGKGTSNIIFHERAVPPYSCTKRRCIQKHIDAYTHTYTQRVCWFMSLPQIIPWPLRHVIIQSSNETCQNNPKQTCGLAGQSMSAPSFNGKPWKTLSPCINKMLWVKTSLALQVNSFDPYPRCKNHRSTFSRCWQRGPLFTKMPKVVLKSLLSNLGAWHRLASQAALRTW